MQYNLYLTIMNEIYGWNLLLLNPLTAITEKLVLLVVQILSLLFSHTKQTVVERGLWRGKETINGRKPLFGSAKIQLGTMLVNKQDHLYSASITIYIF